MNNFPTSIIKFSIHQSLLMFLFLSVILVTGCKKNTDLNQTDPPKVEVPEPTVDINFNKLGYGIDLSGEYANISATRFKIINVAALYLSSKDRVVIDKLSGQRNYIIAGENVLAYSKSLSGKLKASSSFFSFKASMSYFDSLSFRSDYVYASYSLQIRQKQLKFNADLDLLKKNLSAEFKADIQNKSPEYLVSRYGTHLIVDLILGSKFEAVYRSQTTNTDREKAAKAGLSFALESIFDLDISLGSNFSSSQLNSDQKLFYRTVGGNSSISLIGEIDLGPTVPKKIQMAQWQASVDADNAELIDIGNEDGVINIADLISDEAKALAVRNYVKQYLIDRQVKMVDGPAPVYQFFDAGPSNFAYSMEKVPAIYSRFIFQTQVFKAYNKSIDGAKPVYQYYSAAKGEFILTLNASANLPGYTNMGVVFYAYDKQVPGSVPAFEYYYEAKINKKIYNTHYYSTSGTIPGRDWHYMGLPFYVFN